MNDHRMTDYNNSAAFFGGGIVVARALFLTNLEGVVSLNLYKIALVGECGVETRVPGPPILESWVLGSPK